jgi:pullulanase
MQEGEDFMRTKQAGTGNDVHNSYKAGDHVNKMDYALKVQNIDMFNYFKDLISFRKEHQALSLGSRDLIEANFVEMDKGNVISFKVTDPNTNEELFVIHSLNAVADYQLGGTYQVVFDHSGKVTSSQNVSSINLIDNGTVILRKV